jgi:hypothetical protein
VKTALAALAPSLLTLIIAAAVWRATPREFVPLWNDEVVYWSEAAAFKVGGFDAGYFTVGEQPAAAAFTHFGPHGPAFAVAYGSLARLVGWQPYSPYIINLLLIPICAVPWLWMTRTPIPAWVQAAVIAGFWPLLLYLPSTMQEPLHFGVALILAALVESRAPQGWDRRRLAAVVVTMTIACLFRPTWALIVPALFWRSGWKGRLSSLVAAAAVFALFFFVVTWMVAPYPYTSWIPQAVADPARGVGLFLTATMAGLRSFFQPVEDQPAITSFRVEVVVALIAGGLYWYRRRASESRLRLETAAIAVVPLLVVGMPIGDTASGREFRLLAPHVLFAVLMVAPIGRWWALAPAVATVVLLPILAPEYRSYHDGRFAGQRDVQAFADAVRSTVTFQPGAESGWANTAIMHVDTVQPPLLGLPPGIGYSGVLDWEDQVFPLRSRYVLLGQRDEPFVSARVRLTKLAETSLGTLYRNEGPRDLASK